MFLDAKGNVIPGKSKSPLAIGVPGTIAGIFCMQKFFTYRSYFKTGN
jgi:gamma-glutamyltranspeptidase/glutathione hydrolase